MVIPTSIRSWDFNLGGDILSQKTAEFLHWVQISCITESRNFSFGTQILHQKKSGISILDTDILYQKMGKTSVLYSAILHQKKVVLQFRFVISSTLLKCETSSLSPDIQHQRKM